MEVQTLVSYVSSVNRYLPSPIASLVTYAATNYVHDYMTPPETWPSSTVCFDYCSGVNTSTVDKAIASFCSANTPLVLSPVQVEGLHHTVGMPYNYAPKPGTDEEGLLWLQASVAQDDRCSPVVLDYQNCIHYMKKPIGKCNKSGKEKQGGHWAGSCLAFTIQPNPNAC